MSATFAPAYVFCYTERTRMAFRDAKSLSGKKFRIDVQNSAPPFDALVTSAWLLKDGEKLHFENGSATAIVSICYTTLMRHIDLCFAIDMSETSRHTTETTVV